MTDMLESVRKYLDPPLDESDVVVRFVPIHRYSIALSNCIEMCWMDEDYEWAEQYRLRMFAGEQPPAILVIPGGGVIDGFHRLHAAFALKMRFIAAIDMHELREQILKWYPEVLYNERSYR